MNKKSTATLPAKRRRSSKETKAEAQRQKIAERIAALKEIKPLNPQAAKVIALFISWLEDESGYDEETLPKLKKALDLERKRVGARRLFND